MITNSVKPQDFVFKQPNIVLGKVKVLVLDLSVT